MAEFTVTYTVDRLLFRDDDTKFAIILAKRVKFKDRSKDKNPTRYIVKGYYPSVSIDDTFESKCEWIYDKKYGNELSASISKLVYPNSINGIIRFLTRNVRGVGTSTITKVVNIFGVETLNVIRTSPERLIKVKGVGEKKAKKIISCVLKHEGLEKLSIYLFSRGITNYNEIVKIYEKAGEDAVEKIQSNPYSICDIISYIKFPLADKIALNSGMAVDNPLRIEKMTYYYVWMRCYSSGNMCIPAEETEKHLTAFLERNHIAVIPLPPEVINSAISSLEKNGRLVRSVVGGNEYLYLSFLCLLLILNRSHPCEYSSDYYDDFFADYTRKTDIIPEETQKKAVITAMENNFSIITGGAGTGKTQTVNTLISALLYENRKNKVVCCSPTGRAAKRMSELTGRTAFTIHRFLGITGSDDLKDLTPLEIDADFIICDEASMIDVPLFHKLITAAYNSGTAICFVGDKDQLPPVGVGSPFADLIKSNKVPVTRLQYLFRQDKDGQINKNANLILSGMKEGERLSFDLEKQDFFFFPANSPQQTQNLILRSIDSLVNLGTRVDDIVVLSPMQKTEYGVITLNTIIQDHLNPAEPEKEEFKSYPYVLRENDRVLQTVNNYDLDVFNGDVGKIRKIDRENEEVTVVFEDYKFDEGRAVTVEKEVCYSFADAGDLSLAYAFTVHKAQVAEYPCVIMPVATELVNLSKNILYTAITRAKQRFVFVGDSECLYRGIEKQEIFTRISLLSERL